MSGWSGSFFEIIGATEITKNIFKNNSKTESESDSYLFWNNAVNNKPILITFDRYTRAQWPQERRRVHTNLAPFTFTPTKKLPSIRNRNSYALYQIVALPNTLSAP